MNNDKTTPITADEADMVIHALRESADKHELLGLDFAAAGELPMVCDNLNRTVREMRELADRLDLIFPPLEDENE